MCRRLKALFRYSENGSYTVEAAFIVPIVLGLAFIILYMTFVLHDRVMLQANLDNMIFLLAEGEKIDEKDYDGYLSQALWHTELQETKIKDGVITVSGKVKASAVMDIPLLNYFMCGKQESDLSESYGKIHPETIIRYGKDYFKRKKE